MATPDDIQSTVDQLIAAGTSPTRTVVARHTGITPVELNEVLAEHGRIAASMSAGQKEVRRMFRTAEAEAIAKGDHVPYLEPTDMARPRQARGGRISRVRRGTHDGPR